MNAYVFSRALTEIEANLLLLYIGFKRGARPFYKGERLRGCVADEKDVAAFRNAIEHRHDSRKLTITNHSTGKVIA